MSSDEEELAELRAARYNRDGAGMSLTHLREKQKRAQAASSTAQQYFEEPSDRAGPASAAQGEGGSGRAGGWTPAPKYDEEAFDDDDDDAPVVVQGAVAEEVDLMDDPLRSKFPMAFGEQERKVPNPIDIHSKTERKTPSVGPPRPPARSSHGPPRPPPKSTTTGSVGPPRPPPKPSTTGSVGPPRPPPRLSHLEEEDGEGDLVGPPRPPPAAEDEEGGMVGPPRPPADDEGGEEGGDMVGPPRPPADGEGEEEEEEEGGMVGPPRPAADDEGGEEAGPSGRGIEEGGAEEEQDIYNLPITHEVNLKGHSRAVVALAMEPSGSRIATGGLDYQVRIYDFNGMKADLKPFREMEPAEGHPVLSLSFSCTGDRFLVVTGSPQPRLYDRDGRMLAETIRGDMYIRDMKNTKGHVTGCCDGTMHPTDRQTAMTCSEDGTVRVWDLEQGMTQKTVVKPTLDKPGRVAVTTCAYNGDGRLLAAGLMDGTVQLWSAAGKFGSSAAVGQVLPPSAQMIEKQKWSYVARANQRIKGAHPNDTHITCLTFSQDGRTLMSRAMDDTLKIWDLRNLKNPLKVLGDLPTSYPTTRCIFSPDESLIVTGTAAGPGDSGGAIAIYEKSTFRLVRKVGMPGSVAAVTWHPRLNQIFVGTGDRRSGSTRCLYDPSYSEKGVMLAVGRIPRQPSPFDFQPAQIIKTPHALPMFRDDGSRKRQREKDREDPTKSRRPNLGMAAGMGREGRIGTTNGTLLTQHLLKQKGKLISTDQERDPRESILRHTSTAEEFKSYTAAYAKTQPKPIFAEPEEDEDEEGN